jgi:hypothetical protein
MNSVQNVDWRGKNHTSVEHYSPLKHEKQNNGRTNDVAGFRRGMHEVFALMGFCAALDLFTEVSGPLSRNLSKQIPSHNLICATVEA